MPTSIEVAKIADLTYCYEVFCDYSDGSCDIIDPGPRTPRYGHTLKWEDGTESVTTWYWRGLRPAILAMRRQYGKTVPIYITTAHGARHELP